MATGVVVSAVGLLVIGSIEARASSPEVEASTINQKGALCSQQTDYADALEHFQKAIALDPTNDKYLSNAASASWWLGELTTAGE
jgi:Flp pilus assembly protein TadD